MIKPSPKKVWRSQVFPEKQAVWKSAPTKYLQSFLCVLCALCANPVSFPKHANLKFGVPKALPDVHKCIAPSQKEGALTPRCLYGIIAG
jgi:succinate dehydrogenase/fumarate reductase-like Fe-S protein